MDSNDLHLKNIAPEDRKRYRFFEIVPGAIVWATFILMFVVSFIKPLWAIYFAIIFGLYWVIRVFYFVLYLSVATYKYHQAQRVDWEAKVKELPEWRDYYHLVVIPTSTEPLDVIRSTCDGLLDNSFPKDRILVGLSWEERKKDVYDYVEPHIREEYSEKFNTLFTTLHPDGLEGEVKGKGANAHWLGWKAKEVIDEMGIPYEKVICSYFDSDTIISKQYFWYLMYTYLTHPNPTRSAFQPAVLYSNNIWETPSPMRIVAFSTVFWLMAELMRPDRLYTFSSHAMSFKSLVDVGFWQKDIVTDDSRIFLQCFLHYNGDYEVTPMYVPISMDTVIPQQSIWEGFVSLYKQQRRWAWGVEHFPYLKHWFKKKKNLIPLSTRFKYIFNAAEGFYSWAVAPIVLFVIGRLPLWTVRGDERATVLAQNAPFVLENLMAVGMVGIIVSAILSVALLPPRPKHTPTHKYAVMFFQWLLLPITLVVFGSVPATEAQTRLMLGKYLGFFVTPKKR